MDDIQDFRKYPSCKRCRFQRCLQKGMTASGIKLTLVLPSTSGTSSDSLLERATSFRDALYLRRMKLFAEDGPIQTRSQLATRDSTNRAGWAETRLLRDYLSSIDGVWPYLKSDVSLVELSTHYFAVWNLLEQALVTMREHGFSRNAIFMPDESYCPVMPDAIERLVSSWYTGPNSGAIARHVVGTWTSILDFARHLQQVKAQEVELAVLQQLLFARYEAAFFIDESNRNAYVNRVLCELHRHLKESRSAGDYAICLGRITTLMSLFQEAFHRHSEMMVLVDLHTEERPLGRELAALQSHRCRK